MRGPLAYSCGARGSSVSDHGRRDRAPRARFDALAGGALALHVGGGVQDLRPGDMAKGIDGHPFPDYLNRGWD